MKWTEDEVEKGVVVLSLIVSSRALKLNYVFDSKMTVVVSLEGTEFWSGRRTENTRIAGE